jgi:predicted AAA+ superfamily ATPase
MTVLSAICRGPLAHLLGADEDCIASDDQMTGKVLENFVVIDILKHAEWANVGTSAYHYRQREDEVDLILESRAGEIAAVEIKATATINRRDLRPIEKLRDARGQRFKAGVLVCTTGRVCPARVPSKLPASSNVLRTPVPCDSGQAPLGRAR